MRTRVSALPVRNSVIAKLSHLWHYLTGLFFENSINSGVKGCARAVGRGTGTPGTVKNLLYTVPPMI